MSDAAPALPTPAASRRVSRLMIFFALGFFTEGMGIQDGLIAQPVRYYLKQVWHWTPLQVSGYLAVAMLPWLIKPVYGLVSDFLPLFGYRRKSYLILANALAVGAFLMVTRTVNPGPLVFFLTLTAYAMAVASTLYGALLVESGHEFSASALFVNQQWLWFNMAQVIAALLGGALVEYLPPTIAMQAAAVIVAITPLSVIIATVTLVEEKPRPASLEGLRAAFGALLRTLTRRELWVIAAFLFAYRFSPGFGTPLYYRMTDTLKFSQGFIGTLSSLSAAGWIMGAILYRRFLPDISSKLLLNLSVAVGLVSTLTYLLLEGPVSGIWINFANGLATAVVYVAFISIAVDFCPPGSEGAAFALLMSVENFSQTLSNTAGSYLYEHVFDNRIEPLIWVSAGFTAAIFLLIPLLRLGDKMAGQPMAQFRAQQTATPAG